ncbi:hypothetical protein MMC34_005482 [Xylographa carneopallida]|nr:hypothetical protein [Xylographa carneopallida]
MKGVWVRGKTHAHQAFQGPEKTRAVSPSAPADRGKLHGNPPTDSPTAVLATGATPAHTTSTLEATKNPSSPPKSQVPSSEHNEKVLRPGIDLEDEPLPLPGMRNTSRNSVSSFFANFVG